MLEKDVERPVVKHAEKLGFIVIKLNGVQDRGKPDRAFFYGGRCLIIEFKKPGGKPTDLQKSWLEKFRSHGFRSLCIDRPGDGKTAVDEFKKTVDDENTDTEMFDDL